MIPHSRYLFKAIDSFNKMINKRWLSGVYEPRRLLNKHFFSEIPVKKGIFNIKLAYQPIIHSGESNNHENSG